MTPSAKMFVLVDGNGACIKIAGRANFNFSIDFKTLVTELRHRGISTFVMDLSECMLMDSTFLGVLAGFGLAMNGPQGATEVHIVELLNPNARITDLLENLGVIDLFKVIQCPPPALPASDTTVKEQVDHPHADVTRTCLEAHETLMRLRPENAAKFKDVAQFLAEDLKKLEKR